MKYAIKIHKISTVNQLPNAWNVEDLKVLLDKFNFPNAEGNDSKELEELLCMAIAEYTTNEAAAILLDYKLSEHLNEGQIDQLSHEMLLDRISEEYPKIELHREIYIINQLLYKAYNGKFLNTEATIVDFEINPLLHADTEITKEIVLKCFAQNLDSHNIIIRLFGGQLKGKEKFIEADDVLWELQKTENTYRFVTSNYWMNKNEFLNETMDCTINLFDEE
jgi:hypothetical protein